MKLVLFVGKLGSEIVLDQSRTSIKMSTSFKVRFFFFFVLIYGCLATAVYAQGSFLAQHENLGPYINSPYDEKNPVISPDGEYLYFTRSFHPENKGGIKDEGDIWYSKLDEGGEWGPAVNLGRPLNDRFPNAVIGFSPDGRLMYLRNYYINDHKNPVQQGISVSKSSSDGWSYPENITVKYFMNKSENQSISISKDGQIMLMSIESYGTYGAEDIYVSFKKGEFLWLEPQNLGPTINTALQEMTPTLAEDNKTLYFASNGHGGYGSRDIFVSTRLDDTWKSWSKPVNLGDTINTAGAELSYFQFGNYAYLTSTQNSDGYGDINRVRIDKAPPLVKKPPVEEVVKEESTAKYFTISGKIYNEATEEIVDANLVAIPLSGDSRSPVKEFITDEQKGYSMKLPADQTYMIEIEAKGFLGVSQKISLKKSFKKDFYLSPLEVGKAVRLEHVLFETGTTNLLDDSFQDLDQVVKLLKNNPTMEIELAGHTDNRGNARLNFELSKDRVDRVKAYMVKKGIDSGRIHEKAYGGTKPIASNKTEETRRLNRRVEFTIIKE